jgi:site-specific recombinase XerD
VASAAAETQLSVSILGQISTLAVSWRRSLRAQNKSPRTIVGYLEGVRFFDEYLARAGMPRAIGNLRREHVEAFLEEQLARFKPSTAATRHRSLQQFFRWALEEGEIRVSPMANVKPVAIPETPPPVLSDDELRALLRACEGPAYVDRRDVAIIRLFLDSGMRLAELTNLRLEDLDLDQDVAIVVGKGRRPRACPFGPKTAAALDRYLRMRAARRDAGVPRLWLGRGGAMTDSGIRQAITERAKRAGLEDVHPHLFRHVFAHTWLATGGQETDLMRLAGWRSRTMLSRYGASAADERARDAHRRAGLGERL